MRSRWFWFLPLFAFVPVLMAPSGGYPSNPNFQSISCQTAASCTQQNGDLLLQGITGTGAFVRSMDAKPLFLGFNGANAFQINGGNGGGFFGIGATGGDKGAGTGNFQGLFVNGAAVSTSAQKLSYGLATQSAATTCSLLAVTNGQSANLASIACVATGTTTITFSSAYTTNPPLCIVSINATAGSGWLAAVTNATTTSVAVTTYVSGTATNNIPYAISCTGT